MNFKKKLDKGSKVLLKFVIPELDLDWGGVYFFVKDKTKTTINNLKTITNHIIRK